MTSSFRLASTRFCNMENRLEDDPEDHVDFGENAKFESENGAIVGALYPTLSTCMWMMRIHTPGATRVSTLNLFFCWTR